MSRIGKQPVRIPDGVSVSLQDEILSVKGPKGTLTLPVHQNVHITVKEKEIVVAPRDDQQQTRALWGTFRSHLQNMIEGTTKGFEKKLLIEGVGYRANVKGKDLELNLGFSHPVTVKAVEGISFQVEKNMITVSGFNKELVGNVTASIRSLKKPEPYKGKGIRYENEVIRRKAGKKAVGAGA